MGYKMGYEMRAAAPLLGLLPLPTGALALVGDKLGR